MERRSSPSRHNNIPRLLWLCFGGLAINIISVHIVRALGLPLYLDNIGSALAAALGGYIPGIIVGFLTNMINAIGDMETAYYGSISVLIAVASAWYASKGYYNKPSGLLAIIATFVFFGGCLGSVLTWLLYEFDFGSTASAPLAHAIYSTGRLSPFWSQFVADLIVDIADKTITVLIVALVLKLMPQRLKDAFHFYGWQQAPLSAESQADADHKQSRRISLRVKIIMLVAVATLLTAVVVTTISFIHFRNASVTEQTKMAQGVISVVTSSVDADKIDEYLEKGEAAEGYLETKAILQHLMESSENVDYCYVYRIQEDGCHVVFDPDTPDTPGMKPGEIQPFEEDFMKYVPQLLRGEPLGKSIENTGVYGWELTLYEPIYDSKGVCQAYAGVDINMNHIARNGYQFLARVVSLFFGFFIMILTAAIWLAEYNVILPINTMAMTTVRSAFATKAARQRSVESINALDIRTGDEIENLYRSVVKATEDMARQTEQMERQSETISKLQNGLILVLADMVESRDQCTGDHVRKTAAYTGIIMEQLRKDGVYTDQLTDTFINDVVNSAPLHDVGKIRVSDTILNKPGKLTDEEFDQMKLHTVYGSEVIAQAMQTVSETDSSYLMEAQNLAHYHHEKWNGRGYPCGLSGENIPLSARIMAVADVFDALVSRRSYKEGFPFEKAMAIIKEGSGSHFDPQIVNAFVEAEDEVRRVMNTYMGD